MTLQAGLGFLRRVRACRWCLRALNLLLVLAMAVFVGRYLLVGWQQVSQAKVALNFASFCGALAIFGVNFLLFAAVWHWMVVRFGGPSDGGRNALYYAYTYLARFLPTPAWFVASRIRLYGQAGMQWRAIVVPTALETLLHAAMGLALYGLLMLNLYRPASWLWLLAWLPLFLAILRPGWLELRWLNPGGSDSSLRRRDLILWLALFAVTWVLAGPFLVMIINGLGQPLLPSLREICRIWILASLIGYVAAYTFGGMGVLREFTLTWYLGSYYTPPVALLIAVGSRLAMMIGGLLWAAVLWAAMNGWSRLRKAE